jgi:hypothetical protein
MAGSNAAAIGSVRAWLGVAASKRDGGSGATERNGAVDRDGHSCPLVGKAGSESGREAGDGEGKKRGSWGTTVEVKLAGWTSGCKGVHETMGAMEVRLEPIKGVEADEEDGVSDTWGERGADERTGEGTAEMSGDDAIALAA